MEEALDLSSDRLLNKKKALTDHPAPLPHPSVYWLDAVDSAGHIQRDLNSTTHLHLVPRNRMGGAIPLFPIGSNSVVQRDKFSFLFLSM